MLTLNQLKRENQRLKNIQEGLKDMGEIQQKRKELLMENKRLARDIKYGKSNGVGKKVGKAFVEVGKASGRGIAIAGRGAFRGLQRYSRFLQEQERKQMILNRKLKTHKKLSKKRK